MDDLITAIDAAKQQRRREHTEYGDGVDAADANVDGETNTLERIWEALRTHQDIDKRHEDSAIRESRSTGPDATGNTIDGSTELDDADISPGDRLYASTDRMWLELTGHGYDKQRVPDREFELLSVIAAAGPVGIAQGNARRLTGQDKQSVPKRTDNLAEKGYILKTPAVLNATRTSLLRLKRLVPRNSDGGYSENPTILPPSLPRRANTGKKYKTKAKLATSAKPAKAVKLFSPAPAAAAASSIELPSSFDLVFKLLREQPNHTLAVQDLGVALGLSMNRADTAALYDFVRYLAWTECVSRCKARPRDDKGNVRFVTIPCIQLVREPSEGERASWPEDMRISQLMALKSTIAEPNPEIARRRKHRTEIRQIAHLNTPSTGLYNAGDEEMPLGNLVLDLLKYAGVRGLRSQDILERLPRFGSRKPLDDFLGSLIADQTDTQPCSLKITRQQRGVAISKYFLYRAAIHTPTDFEAAEVVGELEPFADKTNGTALESAERDLWGFPKVSPIAFVKSDGRSSLRQCRPDTSTSDFEEPIGNVQSEMNSASAPDTPGIQGAGSGPRKSGRKRKAKAAFFDAMSDLENDVTDDKGPSPDISLGSRRPDRPKKVTSSAAAGLGTKKPIVRHRITTEKDERECERWARRTAEQRVRLEILRRKAMSDVVLTGEREQQVASEHESDKELQESRIAEIESALLDRMLPGIYINPPGAKAMKAEYFIQVGRPRNAVIAAIKTEALRARPWFVDEPPRVAPLAPKRRTKWVGREVRFRKSKDKVDEGEDEDFDDEAGIDEDNDKGVSKEYDSLDTDANEAGRNVLVDDSSRFERTRSSISPAPAINKVSKVNDTPQTTSKDFEATVGQEPSGRHSGPNQPIQLGGELPFMSPLTTFTTPEVTGSLGSESQRVDGTVFSTPNPAGAPQGVVQSVEKATQHAADSPNGSFLAEQAPTELLDKAYVLAHPGEAFHHVGHGRYKRGPRLTKKPRTDDEPPSWSLKHGLRVATSTASNRRPTIYAEPQKADDTIWASDSTAPAQVEKSNSMPSNDRYLNTATFDKAHVEQNGGRGLFQHIGGGRWRRRPQSSHTAPSQALLAQQYLCQKHSESDVFASLSKTGEASERQRRESGTVPVPSVPVPQDTVFPTDNLPLDRAAIVESSAQLPENNQDAKVVTGSPSGTDQVVVAHESEHQTRASSERDEAIASSVQDAKHAAPSRTASLTPAHRPSSSTIPSAPRRRTTMLMEMIKQCGGIYPGAKELWYPFATAWARISDVPPERAVVEGSIKSLVHSAKLRKITFSFQSKRGTNETRSMLLLPDHDVSAERQEQVKQAIIDAFPKPYIPPEVDVSPGLKREIATSTIKRNGNTSSKDADSGWYYSARGERAGRQKDVITDEFPEIEGLVVQRTEQGMELLNEERSRNAARQAAFQRKRASELGLGTRQDDSTDNDAEHEVVDLRTAVVTFQVPPPHLQVIASNGPTNTEWLRLAPGQSKHTPSGTYGTRGSWPAKMDLSPAQPKLRRRDSMARPDSSKAILPESLWLPLPRAPKDTTTYDRAYRDAHPELEFHHVGNGRFRLGPKPTSVLRFTPEGTPASMESNDETPELFDKAHVAAHPNEDFYHAGSGRYRKGRNPLTNGRASTRSFGNSGNHAEGVNLLPSQAAHFVPDPNWLLSAIHRPKSKPLGAAKERPAAAKDAYAASRQPINPWADQKWEAISGRMLAPKPALVDYSSPADSFDIVHHTPTNLCQGVWGADSSADQTPGIRTSRSGRRLVKSKKVVEAGFVETPDFIEDGHYTVSQPAESCSPIAASRKRQRSPVEDFSDDPSIHDTTKKRTYKKRKTSAVSITRKSDFADVDELIIAVALVRMLCSGLEQNSTPWEVITHALSYKYATSFLTMKWQTVKRSSRAGEPAELQNLLRQPFLEAYGQGKLPALDFANLAATDWPAYLQWAKETLYRLQESKNRAFQFPTDADELIDEYIVEKPRQVYEPDLNRYHQITADYARRDTALSLLHGASLSADSDYLDDPADTKILKSWCRAVAVTRQAVYDAAAAHQKVATFPSGQVKRAIDELLAAQILGAEKKGRLLPGRNFYLTRLVMQQLERWPGEDTAFLRNVAETRSKILTIIQESGEYHLSYHVTDPEVVLLTNMVAQGFLKSTVVLPPRNDDPDAPLPRFGLWGVDDIPTLHNSHAANKERYRFPVVYKKTEAFAAEQPLKLVPVPQTLPDGRLPLWVDIHDNFMPDMWEAVMQSVLHVLVYRPGATANSIEKAHERMLWAWEIEQVLHWMEETGLAMRFGPREERDGIWKGGWRATEWWYCAFSPNVGIWKSDEGSAREEDVEMELGQ